MSSPIGMAIDNSSIRVPVNEIPAVPFMRLVRVELRKTIDTRAGRWLLIAIGVITAAAMVLFLSFAEGFDMNFTSFVGIAATPQGFLLPILGILTITSEWSQRTGLVTFTLEPHRGRVLAAKFVAVLFMGIAAVVLLVTLAALFNVLAREALGGSGDWGPGWFGVRNVFILQIFGLLGGLAFGMILLNSAAAIVLSFILPAVMSILVSLVPWLQKAAPWIDLNTAQSPMLDPTNGGHLTGDDWLHLAVTSLWWIWIPLLAGAYRVMRSEVK